MTEPHLPPDPQPLNYATPPRRPGAAGNLPFLLQMALGSLALILSVALFWGILAFGLTYLLGSPYARYFVMAGYYLIPGSLVTLNIVALIRWRWPGFLAGCLLTIGLGLLIGMGLCFYIFNNSHFR